MFTEPRNIGQGHQLHFVISSTSKDATVIQVLLLRAFYIPNNLSIIKVSGQNNKKYP